MKRTAVVVGAGWSGLACALRLVDAGWRVELVEAAPQAGGRTRGLQVPLGDGTYALDNGQHLLIGAYTATLAAMQRVGIAEGDAFVRLPLALEYPDGFRFRAAARLPAPLHVGAGLLCASGLAWRERAALVRWIRNQRRAGWRAPADATATSLFPDTPPALVARIWEPLSIAALNAPLAQASATMFLTVLRDSIAAHARASDLLVPRRDLSTLFPEAACAALASEATLWMRTVAQRLVFDAAGAGPGARWTVGLRDGEVSADAVVLCLPPDRAGALLDSAQQPALADAVRMLDAIEFAPIVTVYVRYATGTRLAAPLGALVADAARNEFGQWIFDRGAVDPACDGVMGVVISARGPHTELPREALGTSVVAQLARQLGLGPALGSYVVTEKRAAIVPVPGLQRPATRLPLPGLYLAGDAADSPYPSTIEGSVRSGIAAADACIADHAAADGSLPLQGVATA